MHKANQKNETNIPVQMTWDSILGSEDVKNKIRSVPPARSVSQNPQTSSNTTNKKPQGHPDSKDKANAVEIFMEKAILQSKRELEERSKSHNKKRPKMIPKFSLGDFMDAVKTGAKQKALAKRKKEADEIGHVDHSVDDLPTILFAVETHLRECQRRRRKANPRAAKYFQPDEDILMEDILVCKQIYRLNPYEYDPCNIISSHFKRSLRVE